jgi:hypothetical protein
MKKYLFKFSLFRWSLLLAMAYGYPELAIHLIQHGASINQTDESNM